MSSPLVILEGVFFAHGGELSVVRFDGPTVSINGTLSILVGLELEGSLHHFPSPLDKSLPGGGACMWRGSCPHGHRERPQWLFHQTFSGVLSDREGQWFVGETPLGFDKMPGHRGRLVLLREQDTESVDPDKSPEDLMEEATRLADLLSGLKAAVKK